MHTPYIFFRKNVNKAALDKLALKNRKLVLKTCGDYTLAFFPPNNPRFLQELDDRVYIEDNNLWFEDGFFVKYPEPYESVAKNKLPLFDIPTIELDGAFSRIRIKDGVLLVDGSATYLQSMFSYGEREEFVFSNNYILIESYLKISNKTLTVSDLYFASHLFQATLAYYMFCGTQWKEISFHDSHEDLRFDGVLSSTLANKFKYPEFETLPRSERIELLRLRLIHCLTEFSRWTQAPEICIQLTAGRDSRLSLSLFKENLKDKIKIETFGHPHTTDRIISSFISDIYELKQADEIPPQIGSGFSYQNLLGTKHPYRFHIPMFLLQEYITDFNSEKCVANGFLGNVIASNGNRKQQVLDPEKSALSPEAFKEIDQIYNEKISQISEVYGEQQAFRVFNLAYNTTNKVSGCLARLKRFAFSIFESDLFFLSYSLEDASSKATNNLHYELLKSTDSYLARCIPFEPAKSFSATGTTYQTTFFPGLMRFPGYRVFLQKNFENVIHHIRKHISKLPYLRPEFLVEQEEAQAEETALIAANRTNKIYAILGALEFIGEPFSDFSELDSSQSANETEIYTIDFFKTTYLEKEIHASGLSGMVYGHSIVYRSFPRLAPDEELLVRIAGVPISQATLVNIQKEEDGHTVKIDVGGDGLYRIIHYAYKRAERKKREIFRTTISCLQKTLDIENFAVHAKGLEKTLFTPKAQYRSEPTLKADEELIVEVTSHRTNTVSTASVTAKENHYLIDLNIDENGKYTIAHFQFTPRTGRKRKIFETILEAKLYDLETG